MSFGAKVFGSGRIPFARDQAARRATTPYVHGQVEQQLGSMLVRDGLVGPPRTGRGVSGLLGSLLLLVIGGVFTIAGVWLVHAADGGTGDRVAAGTVIDVPGALGSDTCPLVASYVVDGTRYTARTKVDSSGACDKARGAQVTVRYHASRPADGVVVQSKFGPWLFTAIGALLVLVGLVGIPVRVLNVVVGRRLRRTGSARARNGAAGPADKLLADKVLAEVRDAYRAAFTERAFSPQGWRGLKPTTAPPAPAPPQGPPAGWYHAPDGSAALEWWDGLRWSGMRRAATG
jgi:hypothetical protein